MSESEVFGFNLASPVIDNVRISPGNGSTPPTIAKSFGAMSIDLGGSTSLSFTLNNPNNATLTGVGLTDVLPEGLVVSANATYSGDALFPAAASATSSVTLAANPGAATIPAVGPAGLALLALALAALGVPSLYRRAHRR